jgi:hyperosmotically inducible protein
MKILFLAMFVASRSLVPLFAEDPKPARLSDKRMNHQIHSAIVDDRSLPYCAHIVHVKSENGKVELKGQVHTEEEKEEIGQKAADIAGDDNVINHVTLSVPDKS